MNDLIKINYETEQPTVSARDLHEKLNIGTKFTTWFERMKEYGFTEGNEFFPELGRTLEQGGRPATDFQISIDMAKQDLHDSENTRGKANPSIISLILRKPGTRQSRLWQGH